MSTEQPLIIAVEGVSVEITSGDWTIKTGWPSWGRRSLDVLVHQIRNSNVVGPGSFAEQYRINLNSSSARQALASRIDDRDLKKEFHRFVDQVATILSTQLTQSRRPQFGDTSERPAPIDWLIHPFWPATGVTGLAAAPSSYKSFLSLAAALQISTGREILTGNTSMKGAPGTVLYLDWEDNHEMFLRRLRAIEAGAGLPHGRSPIAYFRPMRSLVQEVEELSARATELDPRAIIIDSMSAAIDGSMNDADVVNEFYNAVHALGRPALVITHKSIENQQKRRAAFMGSGMSLARVRMAWNAERASDGTHGVVWECFKDNHGARTNQKLAWNVEFENAGDHDEYLDSVSIDAINPSRVRVQDVTDQEKGDAREAAYQVISAALDAAGIDGMSAEDIATKVLNQSIKTAQNRLSEMTAAERIVVEKRGRSNHYWHPPKYLDLVAKRNESDDSGDQNDLPNPY